MKPELIVILAAPLLLTACLGSNGAGVLRIEPLPATVAAPCKHPSSFLDATDWEIIAGRIGDELIRCREKHGLAVQGYSGVREALK